MKLFSIIAVFLVLFGSFSLCQEQTGEPVAEQPQNITVLPTVVALGPHENAFTRVLFPDSAERKFVYGNEIEILLYFSNNGNEAFNVTGVEAALVSPLQFDYYIQNFTRSRLAVVVNPKEEVSVRYVFRLDAMLDARDYGLVATVYYTDEAKKAYSSNFFNGTFTLVESNESVDVQLLFTYVGLVGVAGLLLFAGYKAVGGKGSKRKSKNYQTATTSSADELDNDWLIGTAADQKKAAKTKVPVKKVKKN